MPLAAIARKEGEGKEGDGCCCHRRPWEKEEQRRFHWKMERRERYGATSFLMKKKFKIVRVWVLSELKRKVKSCEI